MPAFRFVMQLVQQAGINLERFGRSSQSHEIFFGNFTGGHLISIPVSKQDGKIEHRRCPDFQRCRCRLQIKPDRRKFVHQIEIFK